MNNRLKTWLITGGVVLALSAGAVLAGFAIANMTKQEPAQHETDEMPDVPTAPTKPGDSDETAEPTVPTAPPYDPGTREPTETGSEETPSGETSEPTAPSAPDAASAIHELTAAELNDIRSKYANERKNYYAGGVADADGRPISCTKFAEAFSGYLGDGAHIYQKDGGTSALTFVLVNEYGHTNGMLDTLSAQGVKATFFVNLSYAQRNPAIIQRIINEGHTLGSLGGTFPDAGFSTISLEDQMASALSLQNHIRDAYGYDMKYFNYVHDDYTEQSLVLLTQMGYQVVFYSVKYADYDPNLAIDISVFLDTVKNWAHPGVVYNFHTTNPATLNVVPQLVDYLREKGLTVGPLN